MKASRKFLYAIIAFFIIIVLVIAARTLIGNYYKKKFSKVPDPSIIVAKVTAADEFNNCCIFG